MRDFAIEEFVEEKRIGRRIDKDSDFKIQYVFLCARTAQSNVVISWKNCLFKTFFKS